ncbi:uncharacterized protein [Nicotiana tomentosiformis]|uniref:uncharacterized protein n=1 Tax=Nicotiana tomentosiformis TaxID=4098 RepID=UPI00388CD22F
MTVSEYAVQFNDLARHALALVATVRRLEMEMEIPYQQVMGITRRLEEFDIILGMDWFLPYHAILDCHAKIVKLAMPGLPWIECRGALDYVPSRVISFLKVQCMVEKGCNAYLSFVRDVSVDTPTVESVPVVRDYLDAFSEDLSGMPPDRDIDFSIDLLPGTQPIYIPPYHMAPTKLKELKEQL